MSGAAPIELVTSASELGVAAPWPVTNWWLMGPLLGFGAIALVLVQWRRLRARRLCDAEQAFRALCRGKPARFAVVMRELARAHGRASPAAIALSNGALIEAVVRLGPEKGTARSRVIAELIASRGLSVGDGSRGLVAASGASGRAGSTRG